MNAVNYGKADQGAPCCDLVHMYGVAIWPSSCEALLISGNEVSFRNHIQRHSRSSQETKSRDIHSDLYCSLLGIVSCRLSILTHIARWGGRPPRIEYVRLWGLPKPARGRTVLMT